VATPVAIKLFESLQLDPSGKDETKTGVSVAMAEPGKPLPTLWDYHATHPNEERQFDNAMASTQSISIYECKHIARGFDWNKVQTIVDVRVVSVFSTKTSNTCTRNEVLDYLRWVDQKAMYPPLFTTATPI
jgi:hypothetical protein